MKESDMREKIDARSAWYGGKGEEKNGKANLFSVLAYQNSISTKRRKNCSKNRLHIFGLKCPLPTANVKLLFFRPLFLLIFPYAFQKNTSPLADVDNPFFISFFFFFFLILIFLGAIHFSLFLSPISFGFLIFLGINASLDFFFSTLFFFLVLQKTILGF